MDKSRTGKSIKNSTMALIEQLVYNILSFICRTVFIYALGKTYLGFSGLFSDILTLLSLGELGVGTAITYSMYKPAAVKDYRRLAALLNLYKRIYTTIGVVLTVVGLLLIPFLKYLISDIPDIPELPLIYILYLINTTGSYFFVYKKSILITDQRSYITSLIYTIIMVIQNVIQIITLLLFHSFIIYLVIQVVCTLANNICISIYVDKHYAFVKEYKSETIDSDSKKTIYSNIAAMFSSKLSSAIVTSTDNILISAFVSTITLGLYSNYTLFTNMLRTIFTKIFEALMGSIGNLVAVEESERVYDAFRKVWFLNFWLIAFFSSCLFALVNPFIKLWIGDSYLLDYSIVMIVCLNLFMRLIRNSFISFQDAYGLFRELRPKCIAEAIINLVVSLVLLKVFNLGIYGILLGTFISNITTSFWYEPYLLFVKKFNKKWSLYLRIFLSYIGTATLCALVAYMICTYLIQLEGWIGFLIKGVISCVTVNSIIILLFHRTPQFKYVVSVVKSRFK